MSDNRVTMDEYRRLIGQSKQAKVMTKKESPLEAELAGQMIYAGLPMPEREYRFLKDRRFRMDFAWPQYMLAVEVQGSIWVKGGHSTGGGIIRDAKKSNLAQMHGWLLLTFTGDMIQSGEALTLIDEALRGKGWHR